MEKYKLGDITTVEISGVDKKMKDGEKVIRLCNFVDVYYNWAITAAQYDSFMLATARSNEISKFQLKKGQVALTKDSETRDDIGIPTYIADDFDDVILGYHCALITPNKDILDGRYLNALLQTDYAKKYFACNASGSGQRYALSIEALNSFPVPVIPLQEQKQIGETFSALDKKIELNRAINQNLEAMAKQLYDYWFVQFDFPNEEGKPYKSSGGKMVWNEKLKREIPKEWCAMTIGEVENNIITGKTPSCADEDNFGGDIPFITIDDIRGNLFVFNSQRTLSTKGAESQTKKYLPSGSLSISCIGTIGVMGFIAKLSQTNQQINSIVFENEHNREFVYFALNLYFENAKAKTGNVFANMSKDEFASIKVVYPPKQILQEFHNKVVAIFDNIKNNIDEINALTKQRDELLPLLMNGQAMVNSDLSNG
ncbi:MULTISPECIES: restriction endonuclease subunit S [Bacteroidales]|uniref:restriction endonuclease subunit S n=1 Tax=Bacteroidales TaxID=171549 RepID=UPI001CCF9ED8|nr:MULTISPECIES: restriction endonuclease subunit S [Bacteroidales]